MPWSPTRVVMAGIIGLLAIITVQAYLFKQQRAQMLESRYWVTHTNQVIGYAENVLSKMKDAEIGQRGYLLTGDAAFLDPYYATTKGVAPEGRYKTGNASSADIFKDIDDLHELVKDNPLQQHALYVLKMRVKEKLDWMAEVIAAYETSGRTAAVALLRSRHGLEQMNNIRALIGDIVQREKTLLVRRMARDEATDKEFAYNIIGSGLFTYALLAIVAMFLLRFILRTQVIQEALRLSEERLHLAASGTSDGLWDWNIVTDEVYYSPRYCEIIGRDPAKIGVAAENTKALIHPDDRSRVEDALSRHFAHKGPYDVEFRIRHAQGHYIWCHSTGQASWNEQGEPCRMTGFLRDISQRKEVERMKNEFVSTVSHELRTPLTSIRGSLGLVTGGVAGPVTDQAKGLLTIAYNNCERLVRLINDILDIEKIESGKMVFECRPLLLLPLIRQAMEANEGYAEKYQAHLVLVEPAHDAVIHVDADRLTQVLTNLLSNAIKFSPPGGHVTIATSMVGRRIRVEVSDQGQGIPKEFRSRIFQKFAQADSSDTRQKDGTGLGLNIVKAIVEQLKGTVGFDSVEGQGATFFFELPVVHDIAPEPEPPTAIMQASQRILVCEDEQDIAHLLRMILEQAEFKVDIAYNAASAVARLQERGYAAMTLDLLLPDKDGVTLIRELRADPRFRDLPIIVVSAKAEEGRSDLNGDAIGIIDWMVKPIDVPRLVHAIEPLRSRDHKPRILHVEDDPGIVEVLRLSVEPIADIVCAESLQDARRLLAQQDFDLVVLDVGLPDGLGTELLPLLGSDGEQPVPVILFTASEVPQDISATVSAALIKARTSEEKLVNTIRGIIARRQSPSADA